MKGSEFWVVSGRGQVGGVELLDLTVMYDVLFYAPMVTTRVAAARSTMVRGGPRMIARSLRSIGLRRVSPVDLSRRRCSILSSSRVRACKAAPSSCRRGSSPAATFSCDGIRALAARMADGGSLCHLKVGTTKLRSRASRS